MFDLTGRVALITGATGGIGGAIAKKMKDAGATGIYGAAAAGGVIVVTTKSGKRNAKPRITVRGTVGSSQPLLCRVVMSQN